MSFGPVEAGGRDEIGRLARAFNEMARRLRAGRERELEMRRREKLSSLGRMAAGVAHDVRNPLHSINLTLQNLQETARPTEAGRGGDFDRSVAIIRAEIHRLDQLVESFLRFARSDRAARIPVDLAGLATETARLVEKEAERRGIRIEVRREGKPGIVEGDVESIRSSVLNLVLNSFEAMPHGGTLTLSVRGGEAETRLEVADTGRGIPEEDAKYYENEVRSGRFLVTVDAGERTTDDIVLNSLDWYEKHRIQLRLGVRITEIDPASKTVTGDDGSVTSFDKLLLATGSVPLIPPRRRAVVAKNG